MAKSDGVLEREFEAYVDCGQEVSCQITLGTAGVVTTVDIPTFSKGVKMIASTNPGRFSVGFSSQSRSVAAIGTSSSASVGVGDFNIGGILKADVAEVRLLPSINQESGTRKLYLRSTTNNLVVQVEFF